jgi:hypothetical protein
MLKIAKLSRWSINYYNDTANAVVGQAVRDARKAVGGLGEYHAEHDTRTPVWFEPRPPSLRGVSPRLILDTP